MDIKTKNNKVLIEIHLKEFNIIDRVEAKIYIGSPEDFVESGEWVKYSIIKEGV
jgi:hypothetical protein